MQPDNGLQPPGERNEDAVPNKKRLFFTPSVDETDKSKVRKLVAKNYPGLLETGAVSWKQLHANRARRTGGFSPGLAKKIIAEFNKYTENYKLLSDNMARWPSNVSKIRKNVEISGELPPGDTEFPIPVEDGEQQLIYMTYPRDEDQLREVMSYAFDEKKHKVGPWTNPESKKAPTPSGKYNILLNQAAATIALDSDNEYPLRFILPPDLSTLNRSGLPQAQNRIDKLVSVIIVQYSNDNKDVGRQLRIGEDTPVKNSFVPLFVFKIKEDKTIAGTETMQKRSEPYILFNYRADMVDWGDYSKRKAVTYYELRDVMAKLVRPGRPGMLEFTPWVMLRTPPSMPGAKMQHFLVRRRKRNEQEERDKLRQETARGMRPVCIVWGPNDKGIQIVDREGEDYCEYEGDENDLRRLDAKIMTMRDDLQMELKGLDRDKDLGVSDWTREIGENFKSSVALTFTEFDDSRIRDVDTPTLTRRLPFSAFEAVSDIEIRRSFGIYGEDFPERGLTCDFGHLRSAVAEWRKHPSDLNPLPFLVPAAQAARSDRYAPPAVREARALNTTPRLSRMSNSRWRGGGSGSGWRGDDRVGRVCGSRFDHSFGRHNLSHVSSMTNAKGEDSTGCGPDVAERSLAVQMDDESEQAPRARDGSQVRG
uniref:Uncharacterized protein n=1 Tax=Tetraselmis sp. GSL018 TaxID=582737 RepID=A0A061SA54_9CHLO|mmetsp:Transcript_14351/g.33977  ORF Transcript_14351/g.33977 Transcript_14351/m.33977 type:complete len:649 (-) Transcript_14351:3985-5931(-)